MDILATQADTAPAMTQPNDGSAPSFARPRGRAPKGSVWDASVGKWVPGEKPVTEGSVSKRPRRNGDEDASSGARIRSSKMRCMPSDLNDLVGRDIIKRFRNGFSEELIWFRGTITQLLTAYDDLNTWRLPSPKNKQAWAAVVWKGDPKDRVPHQLIDPTTVPFCVERHPGGYDAAVHDRWAVLLSATSFGFTRNGEEKTQKAGVWKVVDRDGEHDDDYENGWAGGRPRPAPPTDEPDAPADEPDAPTTHEPTPGVPPPPPPPPPPTEPALPAGWTAHPDEASGATYYWNAGTGATSWERPTEAAANPSHEEYLAKKRKTEATPRSAYLAAILGDGDAAAASAPPAKTSGSTDWVKHADPDTGVPYFSNAKTGETTWDPPSCGFIDATASGVGAAAGAPDPYGQTASFNKATGRFEFANGTNYWDSVGRPRDPEGRMMQNYFDLNSLEANRAEAERQKEKRKHKKYDWRKYKELKKKEKTKRKVQALLMD